MPPKRRPAEAETPSGSDLGPFNPAESLTAPASAPVPPAKRQRVSRACDQCRAARERCDGKQPQCQPCVSQSRPCTYEVSPKKRGVQTGYIRTLELALGWVFEKVPGSEETLGALLAQGGDGGHPILEGKDSDGTDRLQRRWRRSRVHKGIDRILSGEAVPVHQEEGHSLSVDASDAETSSAQPRIGVDLALPDARRLHQGTEGSHGVDQGRRLSSAEPLQQTIDSGLLGTHQTHSRRTKLIANHWRLLDIYFSYTHSWLPILDKQDLFQASYAYPDHGLMIDPNAPSSAVHSTLWAALALAALHDTAASKPLPQNAPSTEYSPMDLYGIARNLLPREDGPFEVHHSRALLLLSLFKLGEDSLGAASLLVGSAIRILLDPNVSDGDTQSWDGQKKNLTLMSCFIIDTILSLRCNRPPHLRVEDLSAVQLVSENGPDQWEPWTPCVGFGPENTVSYSNRSAAFRLSTFNQLYSIIKIVAEQEFLKRRGLAQMATPEAFLGQLQHAVNTNSPFGNFVPSGACGTASVPTPYLVRATYLWASALSEPHGNSALPMLYDTLSQYQQIFGKSSTPSFLATCVASLANETYVLHYSEQNRELLQRLLSTCFSKPSKQPARPDPISQPLKRSLESSTVSDSSLENSSITKHSGHSAPPLYEGPTPGHQKSPLNDGGYNPLLALAPVGLYQPTFPSPIMPLPLGGESSTAVTSTHPDITTPYPFVSSANIGHNAEADALLDDLAAIEYADTADVDTQFMTNLGFAPGCDITEFLSRGFGGV